MGPYKSLFVLIDSNGSFCFYGFLFVFAVSNGSL